jgi:hypothetical protein
MAGTALHGRLTWQTAAATSVTRETSSVCTIGLDLPDWPGHRAGQHVDVRLTADDAYTAEREYSIASAPGEVFALVLSGRPQLCPASGHRNGVSQKLIENSAIPYSIVHATQFFEFVRRTADEATDGSTVRFAPVLFQPIAGDDVAQAVGKIAAGSPLNGKAEVAAPEQFRMDEFFRSDLAMRDDPRTVVTDPHASYVGTELGERTLLPGAGAILGEIRHSNWPGRIASGK